MSILDKHWRVYHAPLRPGMNKIIEVNCKDGEPVIPWPGFDAMYISKTARLALARYIVRLHNEELNRTVNARWGWREQDGGTK
jgi:hypothetical protein